MPDIINVTHTNTGKNTGYTHGHTPTDKNQITVGAVPCSRPDLVPCVNPLLCVDNEQTNGQTHGSVPTNATMRGFGGEMQDKKIDRPFSYHHENGLDFE